MKILLNLAFLTLILPLSGCIQTVAAATSAVGFAVFQERTVGDAVDDSAISAKIKARLLGKGLSHFNAVDVETHEGKVFLTGSVSDKQYAIDAVRIAWDVANVKEVVNEIQTENNRGMVNGAEDIWITNQLRTKLALQKDVRSVNYSVETVNNVVYLIGIARDAAELERALYIARRIKGVKEVVNHVKVKGEIIS